MWMWSMQVNLCFSLEEFTLFCSPRKIILSMDKLLNKLFVYMSGTTVTQRAPAFAQDRCSCKEVIKMQSLF